jgi:hypothetical protein
LYLSLEGAWIKVRSSEAENGIFQKGWEGVVLVGEVPREERKCIGDVGKPAIVYINARLTAEEMLIRRRRSDRK